MKAHQFPHSPEAERAILGGILLDNAAFEQARVLSPADFFLDSNRKIFAAIGGLWEKRAPADLVTLAEELSRRGELDLIGGAAYLSSLTDGLPRLSSVEYYCKIIKDKGTLRRLIYVAQDIVTEAQREPEDVGKFIASVKDSFPALSANGNSGPGLLIALSVEELLYKNIKPREILLDPILPKQGLMMLYSLRGLGKTYLALGIAIAIAGGGRFLRWQAPRPRRVLYIDGELPEITLKERAAMLIAGAEAEPERGMLRLITPDEQERPMPDLATDDGQTLIELHLDGVDLVILDNLSALCRSGKENEGESWLAVQAWALSLRRRGISVLFVHHAGKGGAQRGTSRREDLLDTTITLKHPADYSPQQGLRAEIYFEKTRAMFGDSARPFEVKLEMGPDGAAVWTMRDLENVQARRVAEMIADNMSLREIAEELGISKSKAARLRDRQRDSGGNCPTIPTPSIGTAEH